MARDQNPVSSEEYESEEESGEEATSESDSEPEKNLIARTSSPLPPPPAVKKSQPQSAPKIQKEQMMDRSDSGSESETESESGSETESDGPGANASKKSNGVAGKPTRRPRAPKPVTPVRSAGAKRPAEEKEAWKDAKRLKTILPETELENSAKKPNDDSKKQLFQRLWSEDDEIVILKGMSDYAEKKKSDPVADLNAFHGFIKENLHVDVTRNQLQDKIRRLKKKYENNRSKEKEGKERTFSKPHEQKAYELSKNIWGNHENGKENSPKVNGSMLITRKSNAVENRESEDVMNMEITNGGLEKLWSSKIMRSNDVAMDERVYQIGTALFDGQTRVEGGREWRQLRLQEMELHMKMLEVMHARTKIVVDALKCTDQ